MLIVMTTYKKKKGHTFSTEGRLVVDDQRMLMGADPTILLTFDYSEAKWVLVVSSVIKVTGSECPPEVKEEWEEQHGYPMPDDEIIEGAQIGGTKFETLEEMQAWLTLNLHKMWSWLLGIEAEPPYDQFVTPTPVAKPVTAND